MLEWAALGPASGPLYLQFALLRMLCPRISMADSFCQSGLSSSAPSKRPSQTTVTEVAHSSPHPIILLSPFNFLYSNYYYRKSLYLFTYLFIGYYLLCLVLCPSPPAL